MSEYTLQADSLQKILNEKFRRPVSDAYYELSAETAIMAQAWDVVDLARPDELVQHTVEFFGTFRGDRMQSTANIVFARFGQGKGAAWVAFAFYRDGLVNAVRPFTEETADMAWLDAFIERELDG